MALVYSRDRVRRLRLVLNVGLVAGLLLALLAVFSVVTDTELLRFGLVVGGSAALVFGLCLAASRSLENRDARARTLATVAGAVTLVVGFVFAKTILGFAMIVLGITILVLALLRDDPDLVTDRDA